MYSWVSRQLRRAYEQVLRREVGEGPTHVGIIQDGNRRYARKQGGETPEGHQAGANTSEQVLNWCEELDISELTLYAFSTENFDRPLKEREPLFDIIESKLYELADSQRVHDAEVCIRALGEIQRLPERIQSAIEYAETETNQYSGFRLNVALAYGGRNELLRAACDVTAAIEAGDLRPKEIDVETIESHLYRQPIRDVDLIIRTGGDERTSNFLPWHANGNEAAVYFCAPYWPEFSKIDFLRGIRTYEAREHSWQQTRIERAVTLIQALGDIEIAEAHGIGRRLRNQLPDRGTEKVTDKLPIQHVSESKEPTETDQAQTGPAD
ncbi:polyprenyl diphosphate synthase [Halohasta salina]|uniref:polyprenyl diphosphate synthase n=1 Tax=Halohasta salina TaxID=2961621 RepID=UPI0020A23478|nr:polyprenyl diphosphate synthase [Halohasta salina]